MNSLNKQVLGKEIYVLQTYPDTKVGGLPNVYRRIRNIGKIVRDTSKLKDKIVLVAGIPTLFSNKLSIRNFNVLYITKSTDIVPRHWVILINRHYKLLIVPHRDILDVYRKSGVSIKIAVVQQGYTRYRLYPSRGDRKTKIDQKFIIGMNGALCNKKNVYLLYLAVKRCIEEGMKIELKIHSPFSWSDLSKKQYSEIKKADFVKLSTDAKTIAQMSDWMQELSCYIYVSGGEGWSFTPRESLYLGIPTIISDIPVHDELVDSGYCCVVKNSGLIKAEYGNLYKINLEDIYLAIKDVYNNYGLYKKKASEGSKWICNKWKNEDVSKGVVREIRKNYVSSDLNIDHHHSSMNSAKFYFEDIFYSVYSIYAKLKEKRILRKIPLFGRWINRYKSMKYIRENQKGYVNNLNRYPLEKYIGNSSYHLGFQHQKTDRDQESTKLIHKTIVHYKFKYGIVIPVHDRPAYLKKTLYYLEKSNLKDCLIIIIDDNSSIATSSMIKKFDLSCPIIKIHNNKNMGVAFNVISAYNELCFRFNCEYITNLDSDAIVSKDWIRILTETYTETRKIYSGKIVLSGFNTLKHLILEKKQDHVIKKTLGGINLFFHSDIYKLICKDINKYPLNRIFSSNSHISKSIYKKISNLLFLLDKKRVKFDENRTGWDWYFCNVCDNHNIKLLATTPSVVQHIGIKGINSTNMKKFDFAEDFQK